MTEKLIKRLEQNSKTLNSLYELKGNNDSLRECKAILEIILEDFNRITKSDIKEIIKFIEEKINNNHDKMINMK